MVLYFTGTGNSRYVAQRFAAALGDDLITANEYIRNDTPADLHSDRPWVFVSPTYGWQIPHIFADFLRRGRFTGSRKAYFVMTCGSEIGNAGSRIAALCADIGLDYQGVLQVVMPENYVAMFYVPGAEEAAQIIAAAQPSIDGGIACVQRGEAFPAPRVGLLDRFKTGPVNTIFYRWFVKSGPFTVSDACIGCGKCVENCAHNGPHIENGKCTILKYKCTGCGRCINVCPMHAIHADYAIANELLNCKIAEYAKAVVDGRPSFHIALALDVSPCCDCHNFSDVPIVPNVGMFASFDPVALDTACADMINAQPVNPNSVIAREHDHPHDHFTAAHPDTDWRAAVEHGEAIGLGTTHYELVTV